VEAGRLVFSALGRGWDHLQKKTDIRAHEAGEGGSAGINACILQRLHALSV